MNLHKSALLTRCKTVCEGIDIEVPSLMKTRPGLTPDQQNELNRVISGLRQTQSDLRLLIKSLENAPQ